jgi:hypothetical protein
VLSWKDRTFSFTPRDSGEVTIPWTPRQSKHWRGSVNLVAKQDYVVPPDSQKKIFLAMERGALSNQGIRGEGGLITQQNYPRQYDVPLAVEDKKPTWMQVRNLNGQPVHIKKGEVVARTAIAGASDETRNQMRDRNYRVFYIHETRKPRILHTNFHTTQDHMMRN